MDSEPELVSQALQRFCDGTSGLSYIPPGSPQDRHTNISVHQLNADIRTERPCHAAMRDSWPFPAGV
jgi:hypothetical protein